MLADAVRQIHGTRVHAWRGIGAGYNKFAVESFLDEVAHAKGVDPLAFRLELTKGDQRASGVIRAAAEMAAWKRKRSDRALGLAFSEYHGTLSAGVAEVSVNRRSGKIKVHNYWIAVDPGLVIQPENVHAQLESAVVYGLSAALIEEHMPEIHTRIVASDAPPTGMGEIGVVAVAPAIGNAVFRLTGKRLRNLPMSPERVKSALA